MDKKEYTTNTCSNFNSDLKYNIDEHFNWPKDYWDKFTWCQYLLPCGLCEKTMQQCPKYNTPTWLSGTLFTVTNNLEEPTQKIVGDKVFTGELKND